MFQPSRELMRSLKYLLLKEDKENTKRFDGKTWQDENKKLTAHMRTIFEMTQLNDKKELLPQYLLQIKKYIEEQCPSYAKRLHADEAIAYKLRLFRF